MKTVNSALILSGLGCTTYLYANNLKIYNIMQVFHEINHLVPSCAFCYFSNTTWLLIS